MRIKLEVVSMLWSTDITPGITVELILRSNFVIVIDEIRHIRTIQSINLSNSSIYILQGKFWFILDCILVNCKLGIA